ncbi:MAG: polymer-forming cytoskeletal protein [Smithellaceae bacterium]|nr:polymer-forming cytoskeletal protein [Smithellaceae bacterium]
MNRKIATLLFFVTLSLVLAPLAYGETSSVYKLGRELVIEKDARVRHAISFGGQITISGFVEGSVVALGNSVVLTETALVEGDIISLGGVVVQGRGSVVKGHINEINLTEMSEAISLVLNEEWEGWSWLFALVSMFFLLCLLVLGLIAYAVIPRQMAIISEEIKKSTLRVACWGVGGLISVIPLMVLLTMSVVGIVLVPLQMTITVVAAILGFVAVAQLLGREILVLLKKTDRGLMTQTALGLIVIWLVGWIPYLGWMVKSLVIVVGMGSVLVTRFGTVRT